MKENKYTLYGDGIHDDYPAIQELIDSGVCEISLPVPQNKYLITKPLVIPSNFKLKLPRYAEIKLADGANCFMLQNKAVKKAGKNLREFLTPLEKQLWYFVDEFSGDSEDACYNFEIEGGIWNFNNKNQDENPLQTGKFDDRHFLGHIMFFYNVRNFRLSNLTLKDPSNFAVMIEKGTYFTVENIEFDFNEGHPYSVNMDGIHLNGGCHYGLIKNLKGACYDDFVALNAYEGAGGDITNIEIDGLFAENCHSAVRLLTVQQKIEHITISNVFGSYYQYCIGLTKYYPGETTGWFDAIKLSNIHASKAKRLPIQEIHMKGGKNYHFPFIWLQGDTKVKSMTIDGLHRREYVNPVATIQIDEGAEVDTLVINDVCCENYTDSEMPFIVNNGNVKNLMTSNLSNEECIYDER